LEKTLVTKSEEAIAGYFSWQKLLRKARALVASDDDDDDDSNHEIILDLTEYFDGALAACTLWCGVLSSTTAELEAMCGNIFFVIHFPEFVLLI
jgi:hypothetical protein